MIVLLLVLAVLALFWVLCIGPVTGAWPSWPMLVTLAVLEAVLLGLVWWMAWTPAPGAA